MSRSSHTLTVDRCERRVLVVDDDASTCELLAEVLRARGHDVTWETGSEAALRTVAEQDFDIVLADVAMEGIDGIRLCELLRARHGGLPVVLITGRADVEAAVGGMRAGACDFLCKPIVVDELHAVLARRSLSRAGEHARAVFDGFLGESAAMRATFDLVARVAESDASVLIIGESGTGKELVARAIHDRSRRRHAAFVSLNCAAVPATLIESELFGHVRGAFTDASSERTGLFERASGGTLFLDEIAELPIEVQAKLLRVLQERVVRPVGGNSDVAFDVRLVTATNRDLEARVSEGDFRADLLFRIDVVRIEVPPLRRRADDVALLSRHFARKHSADGSVRAIEAEALTKLLAYDWPGNVRELENCIERAIALARGQSLTVEDLPPKIRAYAGGRADVLPSVPVEVVPPELVSLDDLKRDYIARVLRLVGDNKSRAAKLLGLDRRSLHRRLAE